MLWIAVHHNTAHPLAGVAVNSLDVPMVVRYSDYIAKNLLISTWHGPSALISIPRSFIIEVHNMIIIVYP